MVALEKFNLGDLKEMFSEIKAHGYFIGLKTYHLNKFDLIVLLRNSQLFDEEEPNYLLFFSPLDNKWKKLMPRKRNKKKLKPPGLKIIRKPVTIVFE